MIGWYDRDGRPLEVWEAELLLRDPAYKKVCHTKLFEAHDPAICIDVSTVWLGLDHSDSQTSPPIIFETMAFGPDGDESGQDRYPTLASAEQGHRAMVDALTAKLTDPVVVDITSEKASNGDADQEGQEEVRILPDLETKREQWVQEQARRPVTDEDRERAVERIIVRYVVGKMEPEEMTDRIGRAMAAQTLGELYEAEHG